MHIKKEYILGSISVRFLICTLTQTLFLIDGGNLSVYVMGTRLTSHAHP
uniref:Uncharacterized protein n=1 Tax=Arundo donax TaxID=35708 RepID=A0A0A9AZX7_ARUDO